jgi:hypothetical protein
LTGVSGLAPANSRFPLFADVTTDVSAGGDSGAGKCTPQPMPAGLPGEADWFRAFLPEPGGPTTPPGGRAQRTSAQERVMPQEIFEVGAAGYCATPTLRKRYGSLKPQAMPRAALLVERTGDQRRESAEADSARCPMRAGDRRTSLWLVTFRVVTS